MASTNYSPTASAPAPTINTESTDKPWVQSYNFDGLRFDAIAAIHDSSQRHIINEIADEFRVLSKTLGRTIHAIGESNLYEPKFLPVGGGRLHAIWSDDIGHAAVSAVTPDRTRGVRSYTGADDFLKALKQGYLYQRLPDGRSQRATDPPPADLAACVNQLQNHDIIGNSPSGLRIHQQTSHRIQRALAALILLHPSIPLIFMGEEYASNTPFYFFSDFSEEALRQAVVKGRAAEFSHHDWNEAVEPTTLEAYYHSRITTRAEGDLETLDWYRSLIQLRKQWQHAPRK